MREREGKRATLGRTTRRDFLKAVAGAVAAAPLAGGRALAQAQPAGTGKTPRNMIFIVADTFRADHLGCYGNTEVKTPNLDKLASEGVMFTNVYADGLPTIPCRRVYHTGKSIIPMKVHGGWIPIQPGRRTLAQILSAHGFITGFIADTYHYFKPNMNFHTGFSSWEWIRGQETDRWQSGPRSKFDPKKHIPAHLRNPRYEANMLQYLLNTQDRKGEEDYFCARSLRAGLKWLERNAEAERFFLFIDTFDPHEPWDAPKRFQQMYYNDYPYERFLFGYGVNVKDIRPDDLPAIRGLYRAEVTFVDYWIGQFIDAVRKMGLLDDTIIVFSTDHGTHLGEEGCVQKTAGLLNSCVARLPLIVRHPDQSFAGKRIDALVSAKDYTATFLSLLGVEHKGKLDGENFWDLVTGKRDRLHDFVLTEYSGFGAIRTEKWHYFQRVRKSDEFTLDYVKQQGDKIKRGGPGIPHLYDLEKDPREQRNVALENLDVVAELQRKLKQVHDVKKPSA